MGVQYQGAVAARSDARFSATGAHNRAPDLVLSPFKEGVDFTLRLLAANRMAKVVELNCQEESKHEVSQEDIWNLFQAMGAPDDDEHSGEEAISEHYQPSGDHLYRGLPHLESLAIIGTETTPSFIHGLTSFLSSSTSFPRFTRLSLQGVNLRGDLLELRGFAEAFRLHPRLQHVQMVGCWFTEVQQANMDCLQNVFSKQQSQHISADSKRASFKHMKQLILQHAIAVDDSDTINVQQLTAQMEPVDPIVDDEVSTKPWWKRLWKSCFGCCCG